MFTSEQIDRFINRMTARFESSSALCDALTEKGWDEIDGGHFATVFISPDGNTIARVTENDAGYDQYVQQAFDNPHNPFFPKIKGFMPLLEGGSMTLMEVLEHIDDDHCSDVDRIRDLALSDEDPDTETDGEDMAELIGVLRRLDGEMDLQEGNFMARGGQVVLTDPVYAA